MSGWQVSGHPPQGQTAGFSLGFDPRVSIGSVVASTKFRMGSYPRWRRAGWIVLALLPGGMWVVGLLLVTGAVRRGLSERSSAEPFAASVDASYPLGELRR